ncbi:nuclease-related domain-containing protein [Alicyclobacillus tolerans]|uniref:Nuclease-related domain-containing protein n=1 Tax=Alicyclobacillus tolerans TaxID=90970 RepID=A0A1M6TM41_9BACL|nr:nuclease-related domain-containing protein [Alicyclobacillus montanus]SHK58004.1 Nuclease-related domain-containing protein [Alicyclobacillus montanus]
MFWAKLASLFRRSDKQDKARAKGTVANTKQQKRRVDPSHIGELGEYKIDVQLRQMPKEIRYISDVLIRNPKSRTGYSQIDHVVITPYGLFVIETKNYKGEIKGKRTDKRWNVSGRFNPYNPLRQNYGHIKVLENILSEFKNLTFVSIISFTLRCRFSVDPELRKIQSNELVIYDVELSNYIERKLLRFRSEMSEPILSDSDINRVYELINNANISDPQIRFVHNRLAARKK